MLRGLKQNASKTSVLEALPVWVFKAIGQLEVVPVIIISAEIFVLGYKPRTVYLFIFFIYVQDKKSKSLGFCPHAP